MQILAVPLYSSQEKTKEFATLRVERFENRTTYPIFDMHAKTILDRIQTVLETSRLVQWDNENFNSDMVLIGYLEIVNADLVIHMELILRKNQSIIVAIDQVGRLHKDVGPIADEIGGKLLEAVNRTIDVKTPFVTDQPVVREPEPVAAELPPGDEPAKKDVIPVPQDTLQVADLGDRDEIPPKEDDKDKLRIDEPKKEPDQEAEDVVADKPKSKEEGPPEKKKKTLLYVGLGALVLGGGVLALTMSGRDEGPSPLMDPPARPGQ